jgi:hypothetical protein
MNICSNRLIGLVALLLASGGATSRSEEPVRARGTAINFSAPKSDAVSTNLSELRTPVSPFQNLESNLKSPFEALQKPPPGPDFRENRKLIQHNQALQKKSLKDSLNERAEQMFLNPEQFEGETGDEAFFQMSKDSLDPYQKKPKNSLERYNDRQERDRLMFTNQAARKNLFAEKVPGHPDNLKPDDSLTKPFKIGGYTGGDGNDSLSLFSRTATNNSSLSPERSTSIRNPAMFNRAIEDAGIRRRPEAEDRMEDFKRLLEGPRYTPPTPTARSSFATPAANGSTAANPDTTAVRTTVTPATTTEWSAFKSTPKDDPRNDFTASAGLVGKLERPQSLPEFPSATKTLAPTTTPAPAPTPIKNISHPIFKIPQRRI